MITTMFFILVPFLKRAPCIIIYLARYAEKGGVLMSIILPNLNHSFVPVPVPVPVPFPDSGSVSGFRNSWLSILASSVSMQFSTFRGSTSHLITPSKRNMPFQVSVMYIWFVFLVFVSFLSR